jgi:glutathione synthase/RimK-type ligase-like ATP-grasp enzyme
MRTYIIPYKLGSEGARGLAKGLNLLRIDGSKRLKRGTKLINWGKDSLTHIRSKWPVSVVNKPQAVALAKNKLETLKKLQQSKVSIPDFTTSKDIAARWVDEGNVVYGRSVLTGSQGVGIKVITEDDGFIPSCPLYTKGIMRAHEYRVHVVNGKIIDYTKKRKRNEVDASPYIRNSNTGWVFCRENATLPAIVKMQALLAVDSLGLDFGALDILYKEIDNKAWVLEVNTAPGLEGTTLQKYIEEFRRSYVY